MRQGLSLGGRAISTYLVAVFLSMLMWMGASDGWQWLQIALNVLLLAGMSYLMIADGGHRGERAATMTATCERMRGEGHPPTAADLAKRYSPRVALLGYIVGVLPLLLLATVNLIAEPFYPPVIVENIEVQVVEGVPDEDALEAEREAGEIAGEEAGPVNWFAAAARMAFMPFSMVYTFFEKNPHGLNLLFLPFALLAPLPESIGYLMGPKLRAKKLEDIAKGVRRRRKKLRVNQKPRGNRPPNKPKMEV